MCGVIFSHTPSIHISQPLVKMLQRRRVTSEYCVNNIAMVKKRSFSSFFTGMCSGKKTASSLFLFVQLNITQDHEKSLPCTEHYTYKPTSGLKGLMSTSTIFRTIIVWHLGPLKCSKLAQFLWQCNICRFCTDHWMYCYLLMHGALQLKRASWNFYTRVYKYMLNLLLYFYFHGYRSLLKFLKKLDTCKN